MADRDVFPTNYEYCVLQHRADCSTSSKQEMALPLVPMAWAAGTSLAGWGCLKVQELQGRFEVLKMQQAQAVDAAHMARSPSSVWAELLLPLAERWSGSIRIAAWRYSLPPQAGKSSTSCAHANKNTYTLCTHSQKHTHEHTHTHTNTHTQTHTHKHTHIYIYIYIYI